MFSYLYFVEQLQCSALNVSNKQKFNWKNSDLNISPMSSACMYFKK